MSADPLVAKLADALRRADGWLADAYAEALDSFCVKDAEGRPIRDSVDELEDAGLSELEAVIESVRDALAALPSPPPKPAPEEPISPEEQYRREAAKVWGDK